MPRDKFHSYLDQCERKPVSIGDYIESLGFGPRASVSEFRRLSTDVLDTYNAGLLEKLTLENGGVAYIRRNGYETPAGNVKTAERYSDCELCNERIKPNEDIILVPVREGYRRYVHWNCGKDFIPK